MSRKKLFELITSPRTGGATNTLISIANGVSREEYEVTVAAGNLSGEVLGRTLREDVRRVALRFLQKEINPVLDLLAVGELARLMRREQFDIVHCHSSKAGLIGRLAARAAGVRTVVFTVQGWSFYGQGDGKSRKAFVALERTMSRLTTMFVCVARHDYENGLSNRIAPESKLTVIENGVVNNVVRDGQKRVLRELGIGKSDLVVGMVGRLSRQKQPLRFLEIARRLGGTRGDVKFVLVGNGPLRGPCEAFIRENGLEQRVHLLGERHDVPDLLGAMDIFVLPSAWEGLPLSIMEAMFARLPVVASRVCGNPELVRDGFTGYCVEQGDLESYVERIRYLMEHEAVRREFGENGYAEAERRFSERSMVERYAELFERQTARAG